ncbi:hypothetical protein HNQ94_000192 [Salirhabdus euzebyi]|uniref:Uncharacterized protein n=1 Tax=Salirhabdus euzebyi TaxID=394506 RepID=A0A841PY40_9BACI|nr:hypothetical protein [Salirhabdus euzebyi]
MTEDVDEIRKSAKTEKDIQKEKRNKKNRNFTSVYSFTAFKKLSESIGEKLKIPEYLDFDEIVKEVYNKFFDENQDLREIVYHGNGYICPITEKTYTSFRPMIKKRLPKENRRNKIIHPLFNM